MLRKLEEKIRRSGITDSPFAKYRDNPAAYAEKVLRVHWSPQQLEIADALIKHRRVFVKASHSVGKTHLAGGLVNWFYDCFAPSVCLTTAPTAAQVHDVLWKEVRVQRAGRPGLLPKNPRMEDAPDHFAVGITAESGDAFQGRHEAAVFIIFDEGTGIGAPFWEASEGMQSGALAYWLVILNPTDTASRAYEEDTTGNWHTITVSALDHPNITAELSGAASPFPNAVRLAWVEARIREWCTPIPCEDVRAQDFEFPPGSGLWYRPGSLFESRVMGRWPTSGSTSVWTEAMWNAALVPQEIDVFQPLEIGCDKARFGDDHTSFVVRRGNCGIHHETHNGWDNGQIAGRLKQLCEQFATDRDESPKKVPVKVDDVQGGVVDQAKGWHFIEVNSATKAREEEKYPNTRSELWFATSERADFGRLDLSRLTEESKRLIRQQVMAPKWKVDGQARRVVEPKEETKKRIGRSPDDADALNLAYYGKTANWGAAAKAIAKHSNSSIFNAQW